VLFVASMGYANAENSTEGVFEKCEFLIQEAKHIKVRNWLGGGGHPICSIDIRDLTRLIAEDIPDFFIIDFNFFSKNSPDYGVGFIQNSKGRWVFKGSIGALGDPQKILKTSFSEEHIYNEIVLIGYQLLKGFTQKGDPITLPGTRILRITKEFAVSAEVDFLPDYTKGDKQLREAVSKELVDIVKSVQMTSGIPGPTVRAAATP
jgi:hypothetical protein